jgi:hypothetical protein
LWNDVILISKGRLYSPEKDCLIGFSEILIDCIDYLYVNKILSYDELFKVGYSSPVGYIDYDEVRLSGSSILAFDNQIGFVLK